MAQYAALVHMAIQHDFFSDGNCHNLQFLASATTKKLMVSNGLLLKPIASGFEILMDKNWEIEPDEKLHLHIEIYTNDSHFTLYTDEIRKLNEIRCYRARRSTTNTNYLELQAITVEEYFDREESRSRSKKPFGKGQVIGIEIVIDHNMTQAFNPKKAHTHNVTPKINLHLHAREFFWKYYFFGSLAEGNTAIHDLSASPTTNFYICDEVVPNNGKAFLSQQPIAMSNAPKQRFQLQDKNNSGKILIKRLPNAGINLISKSKDLNGQQILVAEIYVNQ